MQDFKLAVVQHESYLGKKSENLQRTIQFVEKAHEAGAQLVVFPEINISGHAAHESLAAAAEPIPSGESVQLLIQCAQKWNIYIAAGMVEKDGSQLFNTQFVVGPEGYIGKQRKLHLSMNEVLYFSPGKEIKAIHLPFAKIGIVICYDCTFPEVSRCLALDGAEVLLFCNAARHVDTEWIDWSDEKSQQAVTVANMKEYLETITRCRALENRCYAGVCNMTGESGKYVGVKSNHAGGCFVIDPYGKIIAESKTPYIEDEMVTADLHASIIAPLRTWENSPYQKRRPALYHALAEEVELRK